MSATVEASVTGQRAVRDGVLLNHIGGAWCDAGDGARGANLDPATEEPLHEVVVSSAQDAEAALHAAHDALREWRRSSVFDRAQVVRGAAALLRERAETIARNLTLEEGKPLPEALAEVIRSAEALEVYAGLAYRATGEVLAGHRPHEQWTWTTSAPLGVVVVISPWNFPLLLPAAKIVAALVAGNTVVFKPADPTPLTAAALVMAFEDAGLPAGVLNLVLGRGSKLGPALLRSPAAAVTFTGGNATGKAVAAAALEHHLKYQLELGGNNPALVLADADVDLTVRELALGAFGSTGQKCTATRRVFVVDEVFDAVAARLTAAIADLRLGSGIDPQTKVGPLVSAQARDDFESDVGDAESHGATVRRFGDLPERGYYARSTILLEPDPAADYVQRETFGPMVSLMRVSDYHEGVERCNATHYGLSASLFSTSMKRAIEWVEDIDAGMVHVNSQTPGAEPHMPFGGMKASSNFSREFGRWGLEWYTQLKSVYVEG